jgi:DNA modification methylase
MAKASRSKQSRASAASKSPALTDALQVELWPIDRLLPYAANARTHPDEQIEQIAASIAEFGFNVPCLVDEGGVLIAGHGRLLAAKRLGLAQVPVIRLAHLSETQARAFRIADNRIALNAEWDNALLAIDLGQLQEVGFDLTLTGFNEDEFNRLLLVGTEGESDPDAAPDLPEHPVTRRGDLWLLGPHRLLCGDATDAADVERALATARPSIMVTDPPYGVDYDPQWRARAGVNLNKKKLGRVANDDRVDWREAWALFPGDVAYIWHAGRHASAVQDSIQSAGFEVRCQIIWAKDRFALSRGDYHWQHEPCWYAVRKGHPGGWQGDRSQTSLWTIPARDDGGHGHSTQKPVECMRRPLLNNSKPGDAVYDPFVGTGTTIIAAEMTARRCIAIELEPSYVDVAVSRWQMFTGASATLAESGQSHAEVAASRTNKAAAGPQSPAAAED